MSRSIILKIKNNAINKITAAFASACEDCGEEEKAAEASFLKLKEYTAEEIAEHNKEESPWLLIHGKVYDVKEYMDNHPGGPEILVDNSGKDASEEYDDIGHSDDATAEMEKFIIGRVQGVRYESLKKSSGGGGEDCGEDNFEKVFKNLYFQAGGEWLAENAASDDEL